jgi:hypothetical protein
VVLSRYLLPPKSLDYGSCGVLKLKDSAATHQKMGSLKRTVLQLRAAKVRQFCGRTAMRSRPRFENVAAYAIGNGDDLSSYCPSLSLKPFPGLRIMK